MTDLSWLFGTEVEAHDAYLVTDLGNLFPVERQNVVGGGNNSLGQLNAGVTQALLSFIAGITEKSADFMYLTGTGSVGDLHEYSPFFMVPPNVVNSSGGYVGVYVANAPHTSVPISSFFGAYEYNNSSNTLRDVSYASILPTFESVELSSSSSSIRQAGTVTQGSNGFYVSNSGTYAVKLPPGLAYHVQSNLGCQAGLCDKIAAITTGANLIQTTANGLPISTSSSVSTKFHYETFTGGDRHGSGYRCKYNDICQMRWNIIGTVGISDTHVSSSGNVVLSYTPVQLNYDSYRYVWDSINARNKKIDWESGTSSQTVSFSPVYSVSNGMTFINHAQGNFLSDTHTLADNKVYHKYLFDPGIAFSAGNRPQSIAPYPQITNSVPLSVVDRGIPITGRVASWSENSTNALYASTVHNPNNIVVNNGNTYMIIEKNTPYGYIDIVANNATTSGLSITDVPPDSIFTLTESDGEPLIVGMPSASGAINIQYASLGSSSFSNLQLNIFHNALAFRALSGMTVIDQFNDEHFKVTDANRDSLIYVTTKYVDMPIPLDGTEITGIGVGVQDCTNGKIGLEYLDGTYNGGDNLLVPVVPGFDRVCYNIGGKEITLKYSDIRNNEEVNFEESGGIAQDIDASILGPAGATTAVTIPITATEPGTLTFAVEGIVSGEADVYHARTYRGEVRLPGDPSFDEAVVPWYGHSSHCHDSGNIIPGWGNRHITGLDHRSEFPPEASGQMAATVAVFKNGHEAFRKTMVSQAVSDFNIRPVNTGASQIVVDEFDLGVSWRSQTGWVLCYPTVYPVLRQMMDRITSGEYMLCNSGAIVRETPPRDVQVPVCQTPSRITECGYDVSERRQRSAFGETITVENVVIGDVIEVKVTAGNSVSLGDYRCQGMPEGTGFKRGTVDVEILNPSLQVLSNR